MRDKEMEEIKEKVKMCESKVSTNQTHKANLQSTVQSLQNQLMELKGNSVKLQEIRSAKINEVKNLDQNRNKFAIYGPKMSNFMARLEKERSAFKHFPIGPIGTEVKLKKGISADYAKVVENKLDSLLFSFIVDNREDKRILNQIQSKCNSSYQVIISRFTDRVHNYQRGKCIHDKYRTVIDCIQVGGQMSILVFTNK